MRKQHSSASMMGRPGLLHPDQSPNSESHRISTGIKNYVSPHIDNKPKTSTNQRTGNWYLKQTERGNARSTRILEPLFARKQSSTKTFNALSASQISAMQPGGINSRM